MKTPARALTLVLLLLSAGLPALAQPTEEITFSPHQAQDIAISKALLKAKSSIYMALYSISHESDWVDDPGPNASTDEAEAYQAFRAKLDKGEVKVFDMLKKKSMEEGIKCRLILHRAGLDSWAVDRAKAYQDIGVDVRWMHKTMHHKFAVIDRKTLINGSGNWSRGAAERYSENTVVYEGNRSLTWRFLREFYHLWYRVVRADRGEVFDRDDLPSSEPNATHFVPRRIRHKSTRAIEAYFTSENRSTSDYVVADKIIEEMNTATTSIQIMANHFNMRRISQALIRIKQTKPNVKIQVLMDLGEYDAHQISRAKDLEAAGIECRYKGYGLAFWYPKAQFMHHKVMVVDSERMLTGSYNWSRTAEHKNYENITVHQGPTQQALIDKMEGEFDRLWTLRRDLYPDFKAAVLSQPGDPDYKRVVPVHFLPQQGYFHSPMTLTRAELDAFRAPLEALGYTPPSHDSANGNDSMYFDKETGTFTGNTPSGTFVKDEDTIRPANTPGLVGAVNTN